MTISADKYFETKQPPRKKEPRYLAVIDKDSCTSCNACATVCPVDCIYEVVSERPAQSYHVIDTSRCIGCQLCYRVPAESTDRYALEVCPWNAIDMLHNPNVADGQHVLEQYWTGPEQELSWSKLDEYGYQLMLNGELRIRPDADDLLAALQPLGDRRWGHGDDVRQVVREPDRHDGVVRIEATDEGHELLKAAFADYGSIFLD